jgi:hypothetical protein
MTDWIRDILSINLMDSILNFILPIYRNMEFITSNPYNLI